jgi:hypothetical protein
VLGVTPAFLMVLQHSNCPSNLADHAD